MVQLYDYDNATEQECLDDLQETTEYFINGYDLDDVAEKALRIKELKEKLKKSRQREVLIHQNYRQGYIKDLLDTLEKKGRRIQYIAQRLKELGGGENE